MHECPSAFVVKQCLWSYLKLTLDDGQGILTAYMYLLHCRRDICRPLAGRPVAHNSHRAQLYNHGPFENQSINQSLPAFWL